MKSFIKSFIASYLAFFVGLASLSLLGFAFFILVVAGLINFAGSQVKSFFYSSEEVQDVVSKNSYLVVDLSRGFSDHPTYSAYNQDVNLFETRVSHYGLLDTINAIEMAAGDNNICGIFLTGTLPSTGLSTLQELQKSFYNFQKSGKPIFAYLPTPSCSDYFLASVADKIWIHPFSEINLTGLASTGLYFKEALEKLGIGIQIVKVGTFKSAVEPLIANTMSDADKKQRQAILKNNWNIISGTIARSRKVPVESLNTSENKGLYNAKDAENANLVNSLYYPDEVIEILSAREDTRDNKINSFKQIALEKYFEIQGIASSPKFQLESSLKTMPFPTEDEIAVLYAEGDIVDGMGSATNVGGERLAKMIRELRNADSVKGMVLRINSPGGSVYASEQIRRELELFSKDKKLVVSMGDVAASGGYWIATPAEKIFSTPTTITGSIGVFGVLLNLENFGNKLGITSEVVKTHEFAEMMTIRRAKNENELKLIQKSVDDIYNRFTKLVCESRGIEESKMPEIAEGRVWCGSDAKQLKLVDEYGGITEAIEYLKNELGDDSIAVVQYPKAIHPFQDVFDSLLQDGNTPVPPFAFQKMRSRSAASMINNDFIDVWNKMRALNDPKNIYVRLPWGTEKLILGN